MRKKLLGGLAGFAIIALALSGCTSSGGSENSDATPRGGTLTIGNNLDLASFDTGELDTGWQVFYWQSVYDTLLDYTPDGSIEPNLATEYTYNDDNTVLTLKLRDDVEFTDGTPFNAEAVKANIEHLQQGTGVSVYMVKGVTEVDVLDDSTVEIHLNAPDPAFTYYLCLVAGAMASPDAIAAGTLAASPVGSGPYVYDSDDSITGSEYHFTRNADYWNPDAFPYDDIVIKPMEDLTARMNAIKSGQVNGVSADTTVTAEAEGSGLQIGRNPISWQGLVIFDRDGTKVPALGDVRVRQALNYAIDTQSILDNIFEGAGYASTQIFNKKSPAADPELDGAYPYDPAKAKKLLAEAGYADGFEITMPEFPGQNTYPIITQQLADVGIKVTWDKIAVEQIVPALMGGDYPIAVFGSSSGHPWRDIQKMVSVGGAWNPLGNTTPELAQLLADVQASNGEAQDAAYQKVSAYLVDNAWFGVWFFTDNVFLTDASTNATQQAGSVVPYLRNFAPAK